MKKNLNECIEQYKAYSGRLADAIQCCDLDLINHYVRKISKLREYTNCEYDFNLNDIDLSDVL